MTSSSNYVATQFWSPAPPISCLRVCCEKGLKFQAHGHDFMLNISIILISSSLAHPLLHDAQFQTDGPASEQIEPILPHLIRLHSSIYAYVQCIHSMMK